MKDTNARLLEILEKQNQNKNDDEGKFYKRLAAHKPCTYDGPADIWWNTTKGVAQQSEFTWAECIEKMKDKLFPPALRRMKENEFLFLKQAKMSVLEYVAKFLELSRFAPDFVGNERVKMMRFFEGRNLKCQKRIGAYTTFEELYDRALEQERIEMKDEEFRKKINGGKFKEGGFKKAKT
ncbi:uncharacterized protein LOC125492564 [Beta vulgaris subsp. vulgaris]|uniref:uncharacterized protein LOC125492564 n=1 Tax=Beta vulgaris subsp. vulgaris TaxID=3555 RepID=UPI00203743DA|nr:uncharacterized protein LOC125492564 [Beta vulgaris subsp. vulgaris]